MANTKYSDLTTDVLPNLAADPSDPVTEYAIKRAAVEFIARSWIWHFLHDPVDVTTGEATYDLEPPQGADIAIVMTALLNGESLTPKQPVWLDENVKNWRTEQNVVRYYTQVDPAQIILAPVPSETVAGGLVMTVAVQPKSNSTSIPGWIASKHLDDIVSGALSRLMLMPDVAWANPNLGAYHGKRFENAIANARADVVAGLNRAPTRTTSYH